MEVGKLDSGLEAEEKIFIDYENIFPLVSELIFNIAFRQNFRSNKLAWIQNALWIQSQLQITMNLLSYF